MSEQDENKPIRGTYRLSAWTRAVRGPFMIIADELTEGMSPPDDGSLRMWAVRMKRKPGGAWKSRRRWRCED